MSEPLPNPQLTQIAMSVADLPRSLRFYSEVLGFGRAGGKVIWGEFLARVQDLGDDAQCIVWWLLGRQDFVQLEFFHHTMPAQKPRSADWRPSDIGFSRFGVAVPDFNATLARLADWGSAPITPPAVVDGLRRVCFPDPDGVIVELFEDGPATPGGVRPTHWAFRPAVVYAAVSVVDLEAARAFHVGTLGLVAEPPDKLHTPEHEALWGLAGARREVFVARAGDIYLEVSQYATPAPRAKPEGYLLSDQGFLNVAFSFRERPPFDAMLGRAVAAGYRANAAVAPGAGFASTYLNDGQGLTVEVFGCPREFDRLLGFEPEESFVARRAPGEVR